MQLTKQNEGKDETGSSPPDNFNFENDLQSNEISLQDMHNRLNLKNELIDDEDEPMLGGMNQLNYMEAQKAAKHGQKESDEGMSKEKLKKLEE